MFLKVLVLRYASGVVSALAMFGCRLIALAKDSEG
jgi:hypothetical protein